MITTLFPKATNTMQSMQAASEAQRQKEQQEKIALQNQVKQLSEQLQSQGALINQLQNSKPLAQNPPAASAPKQGSNRNILLYGSIAILAIGTLAFVFYGSTSEKKSSALKGTNGKKKKAG